MIKQETLIGANIQIPENLNWKLKEAAAKRKTTKEAVILLLLQEALK